MAFIATAAHGGWRWEFFLAVAGVAGGAARPLVLGCPGWGMDAGVVERTLLGMAALAGVLGPPATEGKNRMRFFPESVAVEARGGVGAALGHGAAVGGSVKASDDIRMAVAAFHRKIGREMGCLVIVSSLGVAVGAGKIGMNALGELLLGDSDRLALAVGQPRVHVAFKTGRRFRSSLKRLGIESKKKD